MAHSYALALHGGAGTISKSALTQTIESEYKTALLEALAKGEAILKNGGSALLAVEQTVVSLENCPLFNAGKGAVFTHNKTHEMDACIMDGKTLSAGAVAGAKGIKNPISLSKAVMEQSEHVLIAGAGVQEFAKQIGVEVIDDTYFYTEHRYQQLMQIIDSNQAMLDHSVEIPKKMGTVGAVALDSEGNLAAATSTGGMTNKRFGRIGDSPIVGAGTYANNETCAISCTGHGEFFIRVVVAYDVHALMAYKGLTLQQATDEVVMNKLKTFGGEGGLIAIDHLGNIAMPFNSEGMYRASVKQNESAFYSIF